MDATLTCRKPLGIAFRQRAESERMVGLSRVLHTAGAVLTVHFSTRSCHATIYLGPGLLPQFFGGTKVCCWLDPSHLCLLRR